MPSRIAARFVEQKPIRILSPVQTLLLLTAFAAVAAASIVA